MRYLVALCLVACGSTPTPVAPTSTPETAPPAEPPRAAPAAPPGIPEIEARVILADKFRAAGYRILYDVPIAFGSTPVTIDGFDPDKKVGFEYRAPAEAAAWTGEIPPESAARILVIDPTDRDTVERKAAAFLAEL